MQECALELFVENCNFVHTLDNELESKSCPSPLPQQLQTEAPLSVDIIQYTRGKPRKESYCRLVRLKFRAVKRLNWIGFIDFDIGLLFNLAVLCGKIHKVGKVVAIKWLGVSSRDDEKLPDIPDYQL